MNWNSPAIRQLVRSALSEDSARRDITTRLLIHPKWRAKAVIISKEKGVIAGLPLAKRLFQGRDGRLSFQAHVQDGDRVGPAKKLATISGNARSILAAERPALNALQHLSGIATFARRQVDQLKGTRVRLYDTRKTLPGWRLLQK